MAAISEPLLTEKVYFENCPGCRQDRKNEANPGIPYKEFVYIWVVTLCSGLPISSLFPFLYFMIRDLHIAKRVEDIGYYAGFVGGAYMFGRALTSVLWGIVADRYGRKPVIVISIVSLILFNTLFGLSTSYWMAITTRFLLGASSGLLGPIKAYATEVCRKEYQALGLSLVSTSRGIGLILGPAIGGFFAQFADEFFDVILDKGGLDALLEPELGTKLGSDYLKEVKRVLKSGGKFLCLTLAESHVLGLIFSEFRFGWKTSIQAIPQKPSMKPTFQTFMVAVVKENLGAVHQIISLFNCSAVGYNANQIRALANAVENENNIRNDYSSGADIIYSLEDLHLGVKGNLKELCPGLRCRLVLGERGGSLYSYKAVLLDAQPQPNPFLYPYGVFIVPKTRAQEWLFTSEEGQWLIVESSKSARLTMVFLDSRHVHASMDVIKKDLSPLVKDLAPAVYDNESLIPFLTASDGIKQRNIVRQVTSKMTGPITVDDVIYENADGDQANVVPSDERIFRRLIFERSCSLVQSEAFLTREESQHNIEEPDRKINNTSTKSHKKGGRRKSESRIMNNGSKSSLKVDHSCLASSYHNGIISGLALIASTLENAVAHQRKVRTIIIGLGAGILPMFLHGCLPALDIEVVELDPTVVDLAKDYFGFKEDEQLKVHVADGIKFLQDEKIMMSSEVIPDNKNGESSSNLQARDGRSLKLANGNAHNGPKILIVDADSSDSSSGLSCPPADFVEESFLLTVKDILSEGGLYAVNLVSRSRDIRDMVISRMKKVFDHLFSLELEEDVNELIFASVAKEVVGVDSLPDAMARLRSLLKFPLPEGQLEVRKFKYLD